MVNIKANKRELRKLNRRELLEIILQMKKNEEVLEQKLSEAQKQLNGWEINVNKAGSIAEASLALSDVFEAAQRAVDTYTHTVRLKYSKVEEKLAQTDREREQILKKAQQEADEILNEAHQLGEHIVEEAEQKAQDREAAVQQTVDNMLHSHSELKSLLEQIMR